MDPDEVVMHVVDRERCDVRFDLLVQRRAGSWGPPGAVLSFRLRRWIRGKRDGRAGSDREAGSLSGQA